MTRGRRLLFALLLAGGLFALWSFAGQPGTGAAAEEWAEVRRQDLVVGAEVTGTLKAVESTLLGPPNIPGVWNFKIAFLAPEGKEVRRGEPVLGFDTSELENDLQERIAARDSAEKELEKRSVDLQMRLEEEAMRLAEAEAWRRRAALKSDVPADLVPANELRALRSELELAEREIRFREQRLRLLGQQGEAELEALRSRRDFAAARVRQTEEAVARMMVTAPRDGTVVYVAGRGGEKKKIGDPCWRNELVLEIPDLRRMRAEGQIDEADAGRVARGQRVSLRLDAHPEARFTGRVSAVRGSVQRRSRSNPQKVVEVVVELDRTDPRRMSPGMRFVGTVEIERVPGILAVPAEAVFNRPDGPRVFVQDGRGAEEVRPRLGRRDARRVEVLTGLSEGDRVALRDPEIERRGT